MYLALVLVLVVVLVLDYLAEREAFPRTRLRREAQALGTTAWLARTARLRLAEDEDEDEHDSCVVVFTPTCTWQLHTASQRAIKSFPG